MMKVQSFVWSRRLLLALMSCLAALLLSVVVDRVVGIYLEHNGYFYALPPSIRIDFDTREYKVSIPISNQGLRNSQVARPKPKGTIRLLAVGDSFTFGWGVAEKLTWVRQTEKILRDSGHRVEIVNAGVPGVSVSTETDICRAYADYLDVDGIIIGFYGTDDLYQTAAQGFFESKSGAAALVSRLWPTWQRMGERVILNFWGANSQPGTVINLSTIWKRLARQFFTNNPHVYTTIPKELRDDLVAGRLNSDLLLLPKDEPKYLVKMLDRNYFNEALRQTKQALASLVSTCSAKRPTFMVMLPPEEMVDVKYQGYRKVFGYTVDPRLTKLDIDTPLAQISRQLGISYVSLLPSFRRDGCPDCYYPWDIHLSPVGNQRVADLVAARLSKSSLFR